MTGLLSARHDADRSAIGASQPTIAQPGAARPAPIAEVLVASSSMTRAAAGQRHSRIEATVRSSKLIRPWDVDRRCADCASRPRPARSIDRGATLRQSDPPTARDGRDRQRDRRATPTHRPARSLRCGRLVRHRRRGRAGVRLVDIAARTGLGRRQPRCHERAFLRAMPRRPAIPRPPRRQAAWSGARGDRSSSARGRLAAVRDGGGCGARRWRRSSSGGGRRDRVLVTDDCGRRRPHLSATRNGGCSGTDRQHS